MKNRVLFVLLALIVLGVSGAHAQTQGLANAKVPFDFVVNGHKYASGDYSMVSTSTYDVWILHEASGTSGFLITSSAESSSPLDQNKLVFDCYDNRKQCFLSAFWFRGSRIGKRLPKSRHEMELARALAVTPTIVAGR